MFYRSLLYINSLSLLKSRRPLLTDDTILLAEPIVPIKVFLTKDPVPFSIPIPP